MGLHYCKYKKHSGLIHGYTTISLLKILLSFATLIVFSYGMVFPAEFKDRVYRPIITANFINNDIKSVSDGYISLDDIQFDSQTPDKFVYIVKPGDNLPKIAAQFGTTESNIMSVNDLPRKALRVGQALTITQLEGMIYIIDESLTVAQFAHKYSLNLDELVTMNYYTNDQAILGTGEEIFIAISEEEAMENGLIEKPAPVPQRPLIAKSPSVSSSQKKQYYVIKKSDALIYKPQNTSNTGGKKTTGGAWRFSTAGKNFGFANGNCTAYVAAVRKDIWKPGQPSPFRGNAKQRYSNAASAGLSVGKTAKVGSIVVLSHGPGVNSYYGHVGLVKGVNADGTITVESMNARGGRGVVTVDTYNTSQAKGYIYGK